MDTKRIRNENQHCNDATMPTPILSESAIFAAIDATKTYRMAPTT